MKTTDVLLVIGLFQLTASADNRVIPLMETEQFWGYAEFLEVLADPKHGDHDHFAQWAGPFDAEEFDPEKATKKMQRGLPNWRQI